MIMNMKVYTVQFLRLVCKNPNDAQNVDGKAPANICQTMISVALPFQVFR